METKSDALIAKAKQQVTSAKAVKEDYQKITIAPFYEVNSHGVVRTIDKKVPVMMKKGTGKFYLRVDAKGTRKLFTIGQLTETLHKPKAPAKEKKEAAPKQIKKSDGAEYAGTLKVGDKVHFKHARYEKDIHGVIRRISKSSNRPGKFVALVEDKDGNKFEPTVNEKLIAS